MELKDVILSTLAEMGDDEGNGGVSANRPMKGEEKSQGTAREELSVETPSTLASVDESEASESEEERLFLEHLRERLLVLFEGFQSPNNKKIEAKIDLTLNFLEYLLATLDERIDRLKRS